MPRRTSLHDRVNAVPTPRGREAIYGERDAPAGLEGPAPGGHDPAGRPGSVPRWEAGHKRVTFYCSTSLLEAIEEEMARTERTKTQVIVQALTTALASGS